MTNVVIGANSLVGRSLVTLIKKKKKRDYIFFSKKKIQKKSF